MTPRTNRCLWGLVLALFSVVPAVQAQDRIWGIDLSHHNQITDQTALEASGLKFVILKATDGMDYLDPAFNTRFASLKGTDIIRGAYHFYETNDDPLVQAHWFIANAPLIAGDLPPVVDIEKIKAPLAGDVHSSFKLFIAALEKHYGAKPIIYTGPDFWDHAMKDHLPDHPLWVAQYDTATPEIPTGWQNWVLWQHTDSDQVAGVEGSIDASYFNGHVEDFSALLIADPPPS